MRNDTNYKVRMSKTKKNMLHKFSTQKFKFYSKDYL